MAHFTKFLIAASTSLAERLVREVDFSTPFSEIESKENKPIAKVNVK